MHELPLRKRMRDEEMRRDEIEGHALTKGRKEPPSTTCSRIHACTYQYRPCMTRRLTGHADKNEEKLLSHSSSAIFRSKPDTWTKSRCTLPLCVQIKRNDSLEGTIRLKEIINTYERRNNALKRYKLITSALISVDNCSNNWRNINNPRC